VIAVICFGALLGCALLILCDCPVYVVEYKGIRYHFLSKRQAEKEFAFLEKVQKMEMELVEIERQLEATKRKLQESIDITSARREINERNINCAN